MSSDKRKRINNLPNDVLNNIFNKITNQNNQKRAVKNVPGFKKMKITITNNTIRELKKEINKQKVLLSRKIYNRLKVMYPGTYNNSNSNNNFGLDWNNTVNFEVANENGEITMYANAVINRIILPLGYETLRYVKNVSVLRKVLRELKNNTNPKNLQNLTRFNNRNELNQEIQKLLNKNKLRLRENLNGATFANRVWK